MNVRVFAVKISLLALLLPAAMIARQKPDTQFTLNAKGRRGIVRFNHTAHETAAPDPASPHRADAKATCTGCHHTRSDVGAPQLSKCGACHFGAGDDRNPRSRAFDEVDAERAFHQKCIDCHRGAGKGPMACSDCHQVDAGQ